MYCSIDDIKKRIPETVLAQITDDVDGITVDENTVNKAISDAQSLIDFPLERQIYFTASHPNTYYYKQCCSRYLYL